MSVVSLGRKEKFQDSKRFLSQGFQPFFLGATLFSIISLSLWTAVYSFGFQIPLFSVSSMTWHAHEMIFGYCLAVIAGFLLTAVPNWTGLKTISGYKLGILFGVWILGRALFLFGSKFILLVAILDLMFIILLIIAVLLPIIKAKNWQQIGIISKLLLLGLCNLGFYLNIFGYNENGANWGVYGGFYLVISLILTIGGRVFPRFIETGVGYSVTIAEPKALKVVSLVIFLLFFICDLFFNQPRLMAFLALVLFCLYSYRLCLWHTPGIWRKPLLWSLYLSIAFITLGLLLIALSAFGIVSKFIAIHAMAIGGIGFATVGFMARVSLGHSGRNIHQPPKVLKLALSFLLLGVIFRVVLPIFFPTLYTKWILVAQLCWISCFISFSFCYINIWLGLNDHPNSTRPK